MIKFITVFLTGVAISLLFYVHAYAANELTLTSQKKEYQITEVMDVLADPAKKYTIEDMRNTAASAFLPAGGKTSYGYSAEVYWMRFTITNETGYPDWMVELKNPFFVRVSFYTLQIDGSFTESTAIVNQHIYSKEIDNRAFVFNAHLPKGESRTFYMRAETNSYSVNLPVTLIEKKYFASDEKQEWLLIGGFCGILIVMMLHNMYLFFSLRLMGYLYYVSYILAFAVLQAFWLGYGFQYLHFLLPYLPDSVLSAFGSLCMLLGLLFIFDVLQPKQFSRSLHRVLQVCTGVTLLVFVLSLLLKGQSSASGLLILLPFVLFPIVIFTSLFCWIKGLKQAKFMFFGWIVLMLGSSATVLMAHGYMPMSFLAMYGMPIGSAAEAVLFSFALASRMQLLRQEFDRTQLQLFETQGRFADDLRKTVTERTAELQSSNEKLRATEQERQRLLANVTHDLRTPLTLVQGILETFSNNLIQDQPTILKYSNTAYNRVLGINRLIDDLTELSHLEFGQIAFNFRRVSGKVLAEDLLKVFQNEVELAGLSFEVVAEEEAKRTLLMIDKDRMKQVFDNLLANSMKHTPTGGDVRVTLASGEEWFFVTLSDTGTGIAEEDLPHIFERFYQGNHEQAGRGIGLSIVKEIVTQHQGRITVTRLQQGTAFTIQLPVFDESKAS